MHSHFGFLLDDSATAFRTRGEEQESSSNQIIWKFHTLSASGHCIAKGELGKTENYGFGKDNIQKTVSGERIF